MSAHSDSSRRRRIRLDALVSHRFPLDRADEAFEVAADRSGLKVIIEPGRAA